MKRYSCAAIFSLNLSRVVLIHKLRPLWQAGKANFPGGKVELTDWPDVINPGESFPTPGDYADAAADAHRAGAARELREETGLIIAPADLKLFCRLRFTMPEPGECWFYCGVSDVNAARTMEEEVVFVADILMVQTGLVMYEAPDPVYKGMTYVPEIRTMPNLPWLTAMALQVLRGETGTPQCYNVEEMP